MKNLLKSIWEAPASTCAGAIIAALTSITAADIELPKGWFVGLGATAAALAVFSGSKKQEG